MRRQTIRLTAETFGRAVLPIGRVDENNAVRVEIDLSAIAADAPSATASLTLEAPSGTVYPATVTMAGGVLRWDVAAADVTVSGTGKAQLTVYGPAGEVLKSAVAMTRIGQSLRGEGEAPDPVKNWADDAEKKLTEVVSAGKAAEEAAGKAETVAKDLQDKLDSGDFTGPQGPKGDPGPKGEPGESVDLDTIIDQILPMLDVKEYSQLNAGVAAYLAASQVYTAENQTVSVIANYTSQGTDDPAGKKLTVGSAATVQITDTVTGAERTDAVSGDYTLYNIIPGHITRWAAKGANAKRTAAGSVRATGAVRMIKMTGAVRNVRDLGGWACDGGTVKYGLLYRGGHLSNGGTVLANTWDIAMLRGLGIAMEIDIRAASEQDRTTSVLNGGGYTVGFQSIPLVYSGATLMTSETTECINAIKAIMTCAVAGTPAYFHCQAGADRTGTLAFLLGAMLGVASADLDRDYELTSFYDPRYRNSNGWKAFHAYLDGLTGDNLRDKVIGWVRDNGITTSEINAFRAAMIDGMPVQIEEPEEPPTPETVDLMGTYGYADDTRLSASAGNEKAAAGYVTIGHTAKIPIYKELYPKGVSVRIAGAESVTGAEQVIVVYSTAGVFISATYLKAGALIRSIQAEVDADGKGITLTWAANKIGEAHESYAFCVKGTGSDVTATLTPNE